MRESEADLCELCSEIYRHESELKHHMSEEHRSQYLCKNTDNDKVLTLIVTFSLCWDRNQRATRKIPKTVIYITTKEKSTITVDIPTH